MKSIALLPFLYTLTFFVINQPVVNEASQILGIFTHPGKSHFDVFRPLFKGLAAAGHNVSVISYFPNKSPIPNYTDYVLDGQVFIDIVDLKQVPTEIKFFIPTAFMLHTWGLNACETFLKSDIVKYFNETRPKYDVIIVEQFNSDCAIALAHILDAPIISLSSCVIMAWLYERMGSPYIPAHMPMNFVGYSEDMNFFERLNNFFHFHAVNFIYDHLTQPETNALVRQYLGPGIPPVEQLVKRTSLILTNQHYTLNGVYPFTPNIIEISGMHIGEEQPLPAKLKELLDNSQKGVIYISWGSMVRPETIDPEKLNAIMNTVAKFPDYLVLMKWPNITIPNKPRNVYTNSWMPQRDILCHPKVKAFFTHGGLLGTTEGYHCAVPMIVTPFYGDQFLNARATETRGIAKIVRYNDLNEKHIMEALQDILKPEFAQNVKRLSKMFKSRPQKPLALAMWWVEHIIEHGENTLGRSKAQNINLLIRHSFDIYAFLLACFIINCLIFRMALKRVKRFFKKVEGKTKIN